VIFYISGLIRTIPLLYNFNNGIAVPVKKYDEILFAKLLDGAWSEFFDRIYHVRDDSRPLRAFGCGYKGHPEPAVVKPDTLHEPLDHEHPLCCLEVAFKVVAVAEVASGDKHPVSAIGKCLEHEQRVETPGTHRAYDPDIRGVLDTATAGKIGAGIGAPVADHTKDLGFPFFSHLLLTSEQECIDLGHDLRCGKVVHPDSAARAEAPAGTAAFAFRLGDLHDRTPVFFNQ